MIGNIVSGILCTFFFLCRGGNWQSLPNFKGKKCIFLYILLQKNEITHQQTKSHFTVCPQGSCPPPLTRCYNKQQTILMLFIKLLYFLWLLTDTHFSSELLKVTQHWKSPRDKETTILSLRLSRRELGTKKVLSIPVLDDYYILLWNY